MGYLTKTAFFFLAATALAGCLGQPPVGAAADERISRFVERARADTGEVRYGAEVIGAYIDGETVIFAFEIPDTVVASGSEAQGDFAKDVVREMSADFCSAPAFRNYVRQGGVIRVDFASSKNRALLSIPFPIRTEEQCV